MKQRKRSSSCRQHRLISEHCFLGTTESLLHGVNMLVPAQSCCWHRPHLLHRTAVRAPSEFNNTSERGSLRNIYTPTTRIGMPNKSGMRKYVGYLSRICSTCCEIASTSWGSISCSHSSGESLSLAPGGGGGGGRHLATCKPILDYCLVAVYSCMLR